MSQNINLLGPAFRKSQQVLTLGRTLQMAAVAIVTLAGCVRDQAKSRSRTRAYCFWMNCLSFRSRRWRACG